MILPRILRGGFYYRRVAYLLCLIALLFQYSVGAEVLPKTTTLLPSASVAETDDALSAYINPAALAFRKELNLHYLRTYKGTSEGDDAFFVGGWGSAFSMEFAEWLDVPFNRYTLSDGFQLADHTFLGSSYSWYTSDDPEYDDLALWQVGWLHRRANLSLGGVIRNLNRTSLRGVRLPRQYDFGVALRPSTERVTLSMDVRKQEELAGWDFSWGLEIRPISNFFVRSRLYEDKSFDVYFGLNLDQLGLNSYNRFDESQNHQDGLVHIGYSARPYTRPLRRRMLLEVTPAQIAPVLTKARKDKDVVGAVLKLDQSDLGLAQLQEARDAAVKFREQGKLLISYARHYTTGTYLLASACDQILVHSSGEVRLVGLRSEALFAKELLDSVGIRADVERIGEYKSATEQFTRDSMSDAFREAQDTVLDDLFHQLVTQIAEGRSWTEEQTRSYIDGGPYSAADAEANALVDQRVYDSQIEDVVHHLIPSQYTLVSGSGYANRQLYSWSWRGPRPRIALLYARGLMTTGRSFRDFLTGTRVMGSDTMVDAIRTARQDAKVKAVVLRIDSGGGLVLASDILWHELMLTRQEKPLIVSMGDVAASGGYYMAVPAHWILAEPATITGSIGVFSGKYSLRGLYEKLGIHKTILKRGERADFYSDYGDYPPQERQIVQHQVEQIYHDFVDKVADGRQMSFEQVDAVARGRIWTGRQALHRGLVDELGGLPRAIEIAKQEAGLPKDTLVDVMVLPKSNWFDDLLDRVAMSLMPQTLLTAGSSSELANQVWAVTPPFSVGD